jgi:hypothetical protein
LLTSSRFYLFLIALAIANVHENVHRSEESAGFVVDRVSMGQRSETLTIWAFYDYLASVVFLVVFERQRHPALVMGNWRAIRGKELERAAETVPTIIQPRCAPPKLHRMLVKISDQSLRVAGIRPGGQLLQQATKLELANVRG